MLSKEEREAIRARCEAATPGPWKLGNNQGLVLDAVGHSIICDPVLCKDSVFIAHARQDIPALLKALEEAEADRDHWKARAEALGRALCEYAPCLSCIQKTPGNSETCWGCEIWNEGPGINGWVFDEARFAGKEEADE